VERAARTEVVAGRHIQRGTGREGVPGRDVHSGARARASAGSERLAARDRRIAVEVHVPGARVEGAGRAREVEVVRARRGGDRALVREGVTVERRVERDVGAAVPGVVRGRELTSEVKRRPHGRHVCALALDLLRRPCRARWTLSSGGTRRASGTRSAGVARRPSRTLCTSRTCRTGAAGRAGVARCAGRTLSTSCTRGTGSAGGTRSSGRTGGTGRTRGARRAGRTLRTGRTRSTRRTGRTLSASGTRGTGSTGRTRCTSGTCGTRRAGIAGRSGRTLRTD